MPLRVNVLNNTVRLLWNQSCGTGTTTNRLLPLLEKGSFALPQSFVPVRHHNFDGEAYSKTNMSLLTDEDETHTYIGAFSRYGFKLASGFRIFGPCAVFPRAVLGWNVASADKITPESLSLFCLLEPKPDILIIGKGDFDAEINKDIIKYLRSKKINVEILPTEQACSTFNFLNSERRVVAAGLIPPTTVTEEHDQFADKIGIEPDMPQESEMDYKIRVTMEQLNAGNLTPHSAEERSRRRSAPDFREKEEGYFPDGKNKS